MVTVAPTISRMFKCLINTFIQFSLELLSLIIARIMTLFENLKPVKLLQTIDILYAKIFESLVSLDSNKTIGIDRFSPKILYNFIV